MMFSISRIARGAPVGGTSLRIGSFHHHSLDYLIARRSSASASASASASSSSSATAAPLSTLAIKNGSSRTIAAFPASILLLGRGRIIPPRRAFSIVGGGGSSGRAVIDFYPSSGVLIDHYLAYRQADVKPAPLFSSEGLEQRWRRIKSNLTSGVSFGHIGRHVKSFKLRGFTKQARQIFSDFHDAYEKGDLKALAVLCTDHLYVNLKFLIKQKRNRGTRKVLRFVAFTNKPSVVVHGRHMYSGGKEASRTGYGQVTVVVSSRREEYEVDARGNRVVTQQKGAGLFENESICVFEVAFSDPKGRWRLANIVEEERKVDLVASSLASSSSTSTSQEPVAL